MATKTDDGRETRLEMLEFLRRYKREHGYFPTQRTIESAMELSRGSTLWHLKSLTDQGFLTYEQGRFSRTLRITRRSLEALE